MRSVNLLDVRLDDLTASELDERLSDWLMGQESHVIVTPNPEMLLDARRHKWFQDILNGADLSLPDGFGVQLVLKGLFGKSIHRHTGVDTVERLVNVAAEQGGRVAFLGGRPGVAEKAAKILMNRYSIKIEAIDPGAITIDVDQRIRMAPDIIDRIKAFEPDVLIVALGQKKQELLVQQHLGMFPSVRIAIGVGGAFDMISGKTRRAPRFVQKIGLEWLWRLMLEPQRIYRILNAVVVFPITVIYSRLRSL